MLIDCLKYQHLYLFVQEHLQLLEEAAQHDLQFLNRPPCGHVDVTLNRKLARNGSWPLIVTDTQLRKVTSYGHEYQNS